MSVFANGIEVVVSHHTSHVLGGSDELDMYADIDASDILMHSNDGDIATGGTSYLKKKEIVIPAAGTYKTRFQMQMTHGGFTCYARIYKNGVAIGTERTCAGVVTTTFTEDLTFAKDDLFQIYGKSANAGYPGTIRNQRLYGLCPLKIPGFVNQDP